jgi:hypothetical protein
MGVIAFGNKTNKKSSLGLGHFLAFRKTFAQVELVACRSAVQILGQLMRFFTQPVSDSSLA